MRDRIPVRLDGRRCLRAVTAVLMLLWVLVPAAAGRDERGQGLGDAAALLVEAELLSRSDAPTLGDVRPYTEALVLYEYRVIRVLEGECSDKLIRVSHFALYDEREQSITRLRAGEKVRLRLRPIDSLPGSGDTFLSDTLELNDDVPRYHDVGQRLERQKVSSKRYDYRCDLSRRMGAFLALRHQLEVVAWGDSRTEAGIQPELMGGERNRRVPVAYSLAIASSGLPTLEWLSRDYFVHMPRLRWVVVGLSPRMVSGHWHEGKGAAQAVGSPGQRYDEEHVSAIWSQLPATPLTVGQISRMSGRGIDWSGAPWGWQGARGGSTDGKRMPKQNGRSRWQSDPWRWAKLRAVLRELGERDVRVLAFTPPIHPVTAESDNVDDDGTSHEDYREFVAHLRQLEKRYPNLHFHDVNDAGRHDFTGEHFADLDHVNREGAAKLTQLIESLREKAGKQRRKHRQPERQPAKDRAVRITDTKGNAAWATLREGERIYIDRDYTYRQLPEELAGLPVLQTRNDDKQEPERWRVSFRVDRPVRIHLLVPEQNERPPGWLGDWELQWQSVNEGGKMVFGVMTRDFDRGEVTIGPLGERPDSVYTLVVQPLER